MAAGPLAGVPGRRIRSGGVAGPRPGLYLSVVRVHQLGSSAPALEISGTQSWSARMTRARVEREVSHGD